MTDPKHGAQVWALIQIVRLALSRATEQGAQVGAATQASLELVEQWVAGAPVSADEMERARAAAHAEHDVYWGRLRGMSVEAGRLLNSSAWASTAVGNLCGMATKPRGWRDGPRTVLDAASSAAKGERLDPEYAAALARAPDAASKLRLSKGDGPSRPRLRVIDAAVAARIGAVAFARLAKVKGRFDPSLRPTPDVLLALLAERGLPAHASVLAFEERYGGWVFPESLAHSAGDFWLGAFACIQGDTHVPRGGAEDLVPVAMSPHDGVYFLDGAGRMFAQDTIAQRSASPFAESIDGGVARILLYEELGSRPGRFWLDGRRAAEVAAALSLPAIGEGTDALACAWGNATTLVIESLVPVATGPRWVTSASSKAKKALARWRGEAVDPPMIG